VATHAQLAPASQLPPPHPPGLMGPEITELSNTHEPRALVLIMNFFSSRVNVLSKFLRILRPYGSGAQGGRQNNSEALSPGIPHPLLYNIIDNDYTNYTTAGKRLSS
jgi:hypothetical protein